MSDDDVDHELLDLLRKSLGIGAQDPSAPPETKVLENAQHIYDNSIDVALDMRYTKLAAAGILKEMKERDYSTKSWSDHPLHPKPKDESTVNFIFTMDLLNFSFWSEKGDEERFAVSYQGKRWTGYWSLVAALHRALDEGIPVTTPSFWNEWEYEEEEPEPRPEPEPEPEPESVPVEHDAIELGPGELCNPEENDIEVKNKDDAETDETMEDDAKVTSEVEQSDSQMADVDVNTDEKKKEKDANQLIVGNTDDAAHKNEESAAQLVEKEEARPDQPTERKERTKRMKCSRDLLRHVFRSETSEEMPMFDQRVDCLRDAGQVLDEVCTDCNLTFHFPKSSFE